MKVVHGKMLPGGILSMGDVLRGMLSMGECCPEGSWPWGMLSGGL